ncbi:hypothetical protein D3C84_1183840 [compost metagenome]
MPAKLFEQKHRGHGTGRPPRSYEAPWLALELMALSQTPARSAGAAPHPAGGHGRP